MQVLNLEEKNSERMEAINKFTLMDDTFMTQVFSGDLECTEELLKIILKRNDLSVTKSITQLTIGNLFRRSVRLDIYANDVTGKQYDIEVQQDDSGAVPERARLNSALFDSRLTTSGEKYKEMPETYIIFITSNDVLKGGLPVYTIERIILKSVRNRINKGFTEIGLKVPKSENRKSSNGKGMCRGSGHIKKLYKKKNNIIEKKKDLET